VRFVRIKHRVPQSGRTGTCSSCQHQTQRDHFGKNWTIKAAGSGEGAFASG